MACRIDVGLRISYGPRNVACAGCVQSLRMFEERRSGQDVAVSHGRGLYHKHGFILKVSKLSRINGTLYVVGSFYPKV